MRFGRGQRLLGVGIVAVGLAVGPPVWWGLRSGSGEVSQGATAHPSGGSVEPDEVTALGTIQPFDGIVTISIPLADRIFDFEKGAEVGEEVKKGQPLVTLESAGERRL